MKLIVLYGPPGVGKLTVAKELAKLTGFKIFHNHLTIDLLSSLFEWGSKDYRFLDKKLRFELLEYAAKSKLKGVIFTIVYAAETDNGYFREILRRMKRQHVETFFVQLLCSQRQLEKRVKNSSRKNYRKIKHATSLRDLMSKYNTRAMAPFPNTISIDNTELSAKQVAKIIQNNWKL